ncbi:MAG: XdhC family protein [Haloferacaceae archaeon]
MSNSDWSVPESAVLHSVRDVLDGDGRGVLATIIDVEGSAYRRPGAKMVVPEGGAGVGHITAGCLEDEVQAVAAEVLEAGEPRVETYDLRPDAEDDVWGLGVGCNGVIDILLEPIDESYRAVVDAFDDDRDVGVVTVVDAEDEADEAVGARAYYDAADGSLSPGEGFPDGLADRVRDAVANLAAQGRANTFEVDGARVFVDGIAAPSDLVVLGTGHDVGPITELGAQAGFRVTVLGFRGTSATEERFPAADAVRSTSPARLHDAFDFDADTHVVVATHNYVDDRLAVDELLRSDAAYVGLMGPHERFEEMLDDFADEGREFSDAELDRLYTPVGLNLGGGSPHEIALSIVSEALAVSNDRKPGHLRDREGSIHERVDLEADGGDVA